jgi:hypothetical protein
VFAAAGKTRVAQPVGVTSPRSVAQWNLAHDVATALRGSAVFLALALVVIIATMRPAAPEAALDPSEIEDVEELSNLVLD